MFAFTLVIPPPTRGFTHCWLARVTYLEGCPARVGIYLMQKAPEIAVDGLPCTRGDLPRFLEAAWRVVQLPRKPRGFAG